MPSVRPTRGPSHPRFAEAAGRIFGDQIPSQRLPSRRLLIPSIIFLIIAGAAVSLIRIPVWQWDGLWAEDGSVFWAGALNPDALYGLAQPYAGYLHVVPRILALALSHSLPPVAAGLSFTVCAALVVSALGVYSGLAIARRLRTPWLGLVIWLQFVTVPIGVIEGLGNLANLHWYLLAAMCITVLSRFHSTTMRVFGIVIVAGAILSDPVAFLFLPWLALRFIVLKERWRLVLPVVAILATIIQLVAVAVAPALGSHRTLSPGRPSPTGLLQWFTTHVLEANTIGLRLASSSVSQPVWLVTLIALLFLALVVLACVFRPSIRWPVLALASSGILLALVDVTIGWSPSGLALDALSRYAIGPALILGAVIVLVVDDLASTRRATLRVGAGVLVVAALASVYVLDFRQWQPRQDVPTFSSQLESAETACLRNPDSRVVIQIDPTGWTTPLRCRALLEQ